MYHSERIYKPSIGLVFGYLLDIDRKPMTANLNGLNRRFSIALDTYKPDNGDMYFDIAMFENIFLNLLLDFVYDSVEVTYYDTEIWTFKTFSEALVTIKEKEKTENDPCEKIILYRNKKIICYIETEFYTSIGGPYPYHDTYNFAFFISNLNIEIIQKNITDTCLKNNYIIRDVEIGLTDPKTTIWRRIKSLFYQ